MTSPAVETQENPYVGPRPFQSNDSRRFFGREREARDLLSLVVSERLVLFYAQSGAGKSSLINARLVPGLKKRGFAVLPVGRVSGRSETKQAENIFVFNLLTGLDEGKIDSQRLARMTLPEYLSELTFEGTNDAEVDASLAPGDIQPLALIIDQSEEIFTNHLEAWSQREGFFQQIAQALEADPYLWIVLVMREDHVAELDPYAYLLPGRLRARYYMQRMETPAALEAIKKPVEDLRPFDEGIAEKLVANLCLISIGEGPDGKPRFTEGQFIEPVQLQVVCYQLWEQLKVDVDHPRITDADLQRLSKGEDLAQFVSRALADFYEQAIANVLKALNMPDSLEKGQAVSERAIREWFSTKLITESGTRGFVFQGDEKTGGLPNQAVRLLEQQFMIRSETKAAGKWFELSHDRFVAPILQANQEWREQNSSPLALDAQRWESEGKNPARLYQGNQLRLALEVLEKQGDELSELEREFVNTANEVESRQRARRQGALIAIFSVLLVILTGLTIYSFYQTRLAQQNAAESRQQKSTAEWLGQVAENRRLTVVVALNLEALQRAAAESAREKEAQQRATAEAYSAQEASLRQAADSARLAAESARQTAEAAKVQADQERDAAVQAEENAKLARNQALASRLASLSVYFRENKLDLSLLLAIHALKISDTWEGLRSLLDGVQLGLANVVSRQGIPYVVESNPFDVAFSPDGSLLAAGTMSRVYLWKVDGSGSEVKLPEEFQSIKDIAVYAVAFDPSGKFLLRAGGDGVVRSLNLDSGAITAIRPFGFTYNSIFDLSFQPGSNLLAVVTARDPTTGKGQVFIYDYQTQEKKATYDCGEVDCMLATWSPDGKRLAIASRNGSIQVIDVQTKSEIMRMDRAHGGVITGLIWYPDGQRLLSGSIDSRLKLWDVNEKKLLLQRTPADKIPVIECLAVSPDGRFVLAGSQEKGIWYALYNSETLERMNYSYYLHTEPVSAAAFIPQGNRFVTASFDNQIVLWKFEPVNPLGKLVANLQGGTFRGLLLDQGKLSAVAQSARTNVLEVDRFVENSDPKKSPAEALFSHNIVHSATATGMIGGKPVVAVGNFDGQVTFVDAQTGSTLDAPAAIKAGNGQVRSLALGANGKLLAAAVCRSANVCAEVVMFDLESGQPVPLNIEQEPAKLSVISSLAIDEDGERLAIGTGSGAIYFYDIATGKTSQAITEGLNLQNVTLSVTGMAFSSKEQGLLAAGFNDGRIALWEVSSRDPIGEFSERMNGEVTGLAFYRQQDGIWKMLTLSHKGELREWEVDQRSWINRACQVAKRDLTDSERAKFLPVDVIQENVCPVQ